MQQGTALFGDGQEQRVSRENVKSITLPTYYYLFDPGSSYSGFLM